MNTWIQILHLEDDARDAELVQATLLAAKMTCHITHVQGRAEFTQALQQEEYAVILADYSLPGYDGMSALRLAQERCPETPFIFVSGMLGEEAAIEALTQGATDYVLKHNLARLASAVTRALDESENRKARRRAEEENRTLSQAVEQSPVAIVISDPAGVIQYVNPNFTHMSGYTPDDVIGKNPRIITPPEDYQRLWETITHGDVWRGEFHNKKKDGDLYWESTSISPVCDAQGAITHFVAVIEDITARKQTEEALRLLNEKLELRVSQRTAELLVAKEQADEARSAAEAASQSKSEFLSNMSHELRTPLNAILGFSNLMAQEHGLTDSQRENLQVINRNGEHLLTLINQVLDLSKIEAGRMTLSENTFDLYHLLDELEDLFRIRAETKRLCLSFERTPDLPHYVRIDDVKLRQVLMNLLNNAIKFTKEGEVKLEVTKVTKVTKVEADELKSQISNLKFKISDTGPGIAPDELDHLFKAFEQTTTGQKAQEGTGLGLSISQKFVHLMGGKISVKSEVGKGSEFTVEIPGHIIDRSEITANPSARRVLTVAPHQPRDRLLVVDDNPDSRRLMRSLLVPLGFECREAADGQEALKVWEHWKPPLIFMDMRMPVMDGYATTKRIREAERQSPVSSDQEHTIIIALTASTLEKERAAALSAGCDGFLGKPFSKKDMFDLLHKHLEARYIYEKETQVASHQLPVADTERLMPAMLAELPPDLLETLHIAVLRSKVNLIDQAFQEIRSHDAVLADTLAPLAHNFRYTDMLTLIQKARESNIED